MTNIARLEQLSRQIDLAVEKNTTYNRGRGVARLLELKYTVILELEMEEAHAESTRQDSAQD